MAKIALVTDSVAYIPKPLLEQHHITVVPQTLIWGKETYRDGVDIMPNEFYTRLQGSKIMPSTSQASPQAFHDVFSKLLEQDYSILTVVVSERLSGTYSSAIQAKSLLENAPIEVVDSRSAAMAMGFQVLAAARAAEQGATIAECLSLLDEAREKTGVIFAVDTLEFLHRGGRIGNGARLLGTALNLKPILELQDGKVEPVERVRTRKKSLNRLVELVEERIGSRNPVHLSALHACDEPDALEVLSIIKGHFDVAESFISEVSPVVGTHTGPGTVGLAYMAGM